MARRNLLTRDERARLFEPRTDHFSIVRNFTLPAEDLEMIGTRRGEANRLGLAAHLALLRHTGFGLRTNADLPEAALDYAAQVGNVHYAATHHWVLGERTYEVDTHPVSGDGQHGRIWLFTDVTAELRIAAKLRGLAQSGPLTGLPNRRHFEEQAAQILTAAGAAEHTVALLMVDVDHFKQINDTHGHPVGDAVLKAMAGRCSDVLRDGDLFAKFGGEEFIGLLTITTEHEAAVIAERLRHAIAGTPVLIGQLAITVTASVGAATMKMTTSTSSEVLESVIESADAALYRAKQSGRNRVIIA